MARPKGSPKVGGRVKGTPNKLTAGIKEAIRDALEIAGGVDYLVGVARDNPAVFCGLVGKAMPLQVTGDGGGPLVIEIVQFNVANSDS